MLFILVLRSNVRCPERLFAQVTDDMICNLKINRCAKIYIFVVQECVRFQVSKDNAVLFCSSLLKQKQ